MLAALAHRGPDDEGIHCRGPLALGVQRLSIIDLEGGHQPLTSEDEAIHLAFNGMIYNSRRLRERLEQGGHRFRSRTDSEVIVHLYEDFGERCVEHLEGMFAFALWDSRNGKLLLARDRLGQKPLFYSFEGGELVFGSEIKAVLAGRQGNRKPDLDSLFHFLSLRYVPSPATMFRGISELPPGHTLILRQGQLSIEPYWTLSFEDKLDLPKSEMLSRLRSLLIESIESHLHSDVPVGTFLSGGLDSSMVTAIIARDLGQRHKAFAVSVEEQAIDELPHARIVAEHLHVPLVSKRVTADIVTSLPKIIWHLDQPSDPIAACMHQAAALAGSQVKVVLGGDGGDELFAGFDRYYVGRYAHWYRQLPRFARDRLFRPLVSRLPESLDYKSWSQKIRWLSKVGEESTIARQFATASTYFRFDETAKHSLLTDRFLNEVDSRDSIDLLAASFEQAPASTDLDRMLWVEYQGRLPCHSLLLVDRMSMACGIEQRSPLLDHRLVEFMARVPSSQKTGERQLKHLLREVAREYLPAEIVDRPKQGFTLPVGTWLQEGLHPLARDLVLNSFWIDEGLVHRDAVTRILVEHREGRVDHHVRLWLLMTTELWHQILIREEPLGRVTDRVTDLVAAA